MGKNSNILWTNDTVNPIKPTDSSKHGGFWCTKISSGCANCYSERFSLKTGGVEYTSDKDVEFMVNEKTRYHIIRENRVIFICSMSDLFHERISFEMIDEVLSWTVQSSYYIILTKRDKRMVEYFKTRECKDNYIVSVTVEDGNNYSRLDSLRLIDAKIKMVSIEPLLSGMPDIDLSGIDWTIVGGESCYDLSAREMKLSWAVNLMQICNNLKIPFFFKQTGTFYAKKINAYRSGNYKGEDISTFPDILKKREVPIQLLNILNHD